MDPTLLTAIVETSKPNASPNNPYGYTYVPVAQTAALDLLEAGKMIQKGSTSADGQSWAVRPTEQAVKWHTESSQAPHMPQAEVAQRQAQPVVQHAPQSAPQPHVGVAVQLEDNVPMPEGRKFGRQSAGPSQIDLYPFNTMNIGQSFFLPQDNPPRIGEDGKVVPKHRSFGNVVSQANKKFEPKAFKVFEENNGARIYRMADLTAPRPTRTRSKPSVSQVQPGAPVASYPAAGQFGGSVLGQAPQAQPGPGMFGPGPAPAWAPQDNPAPFAGSGFQNTGGAAAHAAGGPAFTPPTDWGSAPGFASQEPPFEP